MSLSGQLRSAARVLAERLGRGGTRVPAWRRVDWLLATAIFVGGGFWGAHFERAWHAAGNTAQFYQADLEPVVMFACGHGFVASALPEPIPGLRDFLELRVDSFDCAHIPEVFPTQPHRQHALFYLMHAIGVTWRLLGVSWSGLAPLFGVVCGLVLALAFGLFRLGMGVPLSLAGVFALAVSTLHLVNLPHLRDYAKAPFVLASILVMALLVTGAVTRRRVLGLAALAGVVLGVGYGVRTDLLASIPPLLLTLVLFLRGGIRSHAGLKLQAVGVVLGAFVLFAWPVVSFVSQRGGCERHVVLLGFSPYFDDSLGIVPASYEWGPYSDAYIHTAVGSFYRPGADAATGPVYCSPEYDELTTRYLVSIVQSFPGDIATRAVASMGGVLDAPAWSFVAPISDTLGPLYHRRADVLRWLSGWAPVLAVPVLVGLAASDLRIGLWTLGLILWFGSLPMLQFHPRHYFHLEWMGWAVFGLAASWCGRRLLRWVTHGSPLSEGGRERRRRVLVMTVCLLGIGGSAAGARAFQERSVRHLIERVERLAAQPVNVVVEEAPDGVLTLTPGFPGRVPGSADPMFWVEFVKVELDPLVCGRDATVTARYDAPLEQSTRTWHVLVETRALLLPVFRSFRGFETNTPGCITGIRRSPHFRALPAWMSIAVPVNEVDLRPVQSYRVPTRLRGLHEGVRFATGSPGRFLGRSFDVLRDLLLPPWGRPAVVTVPDGRYVTRPEMGRIRYAVDDAAIGFMADAVRYTGSGWQLNATDTEPFTFLLGSWPQQVETDARLLVSGTLQSGGLSIGLLKNGRWLNTVNVTRAGRFAVVIEPSAEGPYDIMLANNQQDSSVPTRALVDAIAWIEPGSGQRSLSTP